MFSKGKALILIALLWCLTAAANPMSDYRMRFINVTDGLPDNNVQHVVQDSRGYIWIATHNGLARYDAFGMEVFRSNIRSGQVLTHNTVNSLCEDSLGRMWIGTSSGLNMYDLRKDEMHRLPHREFDNNVISTILCTREGSIYIGSDQGLFRYYPEGDSLRVVTRSATGNVMPQTSVKSLIEDSRGNMWIGTWNEGIYRRDPSGRYYAYPQIGQSKSAHALHEDSRHRIWIGSWGEGVFLLNNPYEPTKATLTNFRHRAGDDRSLHNDIIYSLAEEPATGRLWVGTSLALSIFDESDSTFVNITDIDSEHVLQGITAISSDNQGNRWLSTLGNGAVCLTPSNKALRHEPLEAVRSAIGSSNVRCMIVEPDGKMWIGVGPNKGLVVYDPKSDAVDLLPGVPGLSAQTPEAYTVYSLFPRRDGKILAGTYDGGIYLIGADRRLAAVYNRGNTPWLAGDRVAVLFEDSKGRLWVGCLPGLSVLMPDGSYCRFEHGDYHNVNVSGIAEGNDGSIWVATKNKGVLRLDGSGTSESDYGLQIYSPANDKINTAAISAIYRSPDGQMWVGTSGSGLSRYDFSADSFEAVHLKWNLPGDIIKAILSDANGSLWVSTNSGLFSLSFADNAATPTYRLYTRSDGAQDDVFAQGVATVDSDGLLYFGGPRGLNIIDSRHSDPKPPLIPVVINDIKVFGTSWADLDSLTRRAVSEQAPPYAEKIVLSHDQNNFSIEFGVPDYANDPRQHRYEYMLEGYDNDWNSTDYTRRFAYYNNLPSGRYTFRVRSSDAVGQSSGERSLQVVIKPPLWATWWAYLIYAVVLVSAVALTVRHLKRRAAHKRMLRMREMELERAEELNRTKLRFFTNVTHEWLTPLSIIAATADQMKASTPELAESHRIMSDSVGRLTRLLRQVLEFRKAETGNLRLRVAPADLSAFIADAVDNFTPLMRSRDISCSFSSEPRCIEAWFDADKIDKVIYNLLSNAAKYILPGCSVSVSLTLDQARRMAVLTVSDNGPGIPAERLPEIFKRFYEGGNSAVNTTGNGIGLSLTKDLVELHHGTITVSSEGGRGTEFRVEIPVDRAAYADNEIEVLDEPAPAEGVDTDAALDDDSRRHLLVVEDNADLLGIMVRYFSPHYTVSSASDGVKALEIVRAEDIDLIISDVMMPGINGVELCRQIKSNVVTSHIPVILLTANTPEEAEIDAYEAGADSFINKPFKFNVLLARVNSLLRTRSAAMRSFRLADACETAGYKFSNIDEEFIRRSIDCIMAHLSDPQFSQADFAESMGLSRSTLFRKLKSLTGMSYTAFVRNIRLKAACRLMREKHGIRISELAYAVGFNDPKYFSRCFKNEFGINPADFMQLDPNDDSLKINE